ncbi:CAP domain-containing protein [Kitasatospora sp. NPDC052896]|uniref:CAP domain-containing protein n=1 Tax=Kitasatospora sp. NPDC052896 TaxID=3364061 RepID=UPI0037C6CEED
MRNPTRVHHRAANIFATALMTGGMMLATVATATVSHAAEFPAAQISPGDQQAILSETNSVRAQAGQSGLTWDGGLASAAQSWADNPASTAGGSLHHGPTGNAAENMSSAGPRQATGHWASEKSAYDSDPNHDPYANQAGYYRWGHYYNMINPSYSKMGCGAKSGVTVCRYAP